MARTSDPNSATSQFFICQTREGCQHLDGSYAAFGTALDEETLATLDIAVIDRFDGSVEWIKAGAPASFTCHNGRAKEITLSSLPLGILSQVQAERCSSDLSEGDVLLLVSDGATAAGTQWICELLEKEQKNTAQQLADAVLRGAMEKRCDGHDDDITVLCLKLEKRRVRPEGFRSQDQWEK